MDHRTLSGNGQHKLCPEAVLSKEKPDAWSMALQEPREGGKCSSLFSAISCLFLRCRFSSRQRGGALYVRWVCPLPEQYFCLSPDVSRRFAALVDMISTTALGIANGATSTTSTPDKSIHENCGTFMSFSGAAIACHDYRCSLFALREF